MTRRDTEETGHEPVDREPDLDRARVRLSGDPALAKAAGDLLADWHGGGCAADLPGRPDVQPGGPPVAAPPEPDGARPDVRTRLAEATRAAAGPALAAAAAAILLVTFVVRERSPRPAADEPVRAGAPVPSAISLVSPEVDAAVSGAVAFRWEPLPGALRYRLLLVDVEGGDVVDVPPTEDSTLEVPAAFLAERFGPDGPRSFHWIVRARLLDDTEVSSGPRRLHWSAR